MSNVFLGFPNFLDDSVLATPSLSGGSWLAGAPLTNLKDRRLAKVARSTDATLASTKFLVNLGVPTTQRLVKLVAIPRHTISAVGQIRVRLISGTTTPLFISDFATGWTSVGTPTRVAANFTGADGVPLDLIGDDAAGALEGYTRVVAPGGASGAVKVITFKVKKDTSTSSVARIRDTTAAADRFLSAITWTGTVLNDLAPVTGTFLAKYDLGGGEYRVAVATTNWTTANNNQLEVYPATTTALAVAGTGTINFGDVELYGVTTDRLVADSGNVTPWPAGWTAEDAVGLNVAFVYFPTEGALSFPINTPVNTIQVDILDTTNAAGFVDVARLFIAGAYQPTNNMSFGAGIGFETATVRTVSEGGAALYDTRPMRRTLSGVLDNVADAEAMDSVWKLAKQANLSGQIFAAWDPADTVVRQAERSFLAVFKAPTVMQMASNARWGIPFSLVEEL